MSHRTTGGGRRAPGFVAAAAAIVCWSALATMVSGCASGRTSEWDRDSPPALATDSSPEITLDHYRLTISPQFPADRISNIFDGAATWLGAVPVTFDIEIADCPQPLLPNQVCIHPTLAEDHTADIFGWTTPYEKNSWDIEIYPLHLATLTTDDMPAWALTMPDPASAVFQEIAAHEIGHAMGLSHRTDFALMNHYVNEAAPQPTAGDVTQWLSLRSGLVQ